MLDAQLAVLAMMENVSAPINKASLTLYVNHDCETLKINLLKNSKDHNNRNCLIRGPQVGAIAKRFPIIYGVS